MASLPSLRRTWDPIPGLGAVVLAGGQSARMGQPKAWLRFGEEILLQRVAGRVLAAAQPVVVVAAAGQELPPLAPSIAIVRDQRPDRGPLEAMLRGFEKLGDRIAAAVVVSVDLPFLETLFLRRLAALAANGGYDIVVPRVDGRFHPLCAVYSARVRDDMAALVEADKLAPFFLFDRVRTLAADADLLLADPLLALADPNLDTLRNLNTPQDYALALRDLGLNP